MTSISSLTIASASELIRAKELSPVDLVDAVLARIHHLNARLNAYITVAGEEARQAACAAESEIMAGSYRGPLHGIPVSVKDLFYTSGLLTTGGSSLLADHVPDYDAAAVARLKDAGAIIIGKNNLHEFAYGADNINHRFGTVANPWDETRIAGGSSGGSAAAVAAGLCLASIGSDTGGSIRGPAAFCGIVGLRPTLGRVSRFGMIPLSPTCDTVGTMTHCAADAAALLQALAGFDARDEGSADVPVPDFAASPRDGIDGLRVGVPREAFFDGTDGNALQLVDEAVRELAAAGAVLEDVALPDVGEMAKAIGTIVRVEAASYHRQAFGERREDYGADLHALLDAGLKVPAVDYLQARQDRARLIDRFRQLFSELDAIVTPTVPFVAPRRDQLGAEFWSRVGRCTTPFSLAGLPAIAVPCGFTAEGMPASLQLVAKWFGEESILRLAVQYERRTAWRTRVPPVDRNG